MLKMLEPPRLSARPLADKNVLLSFATDADHARRRRFRTACCASESIDWRIRAKPTSWRGVKRSKKNSASELLGRRMFSGSGKRFRHWASWFGEAFSDLNTRQADQLARGKKVKEKLRIGTLRQTNVFRQRQAFSPLGELVRRGLFRSEYAPSRPVGAG